MFGGSSIVVHLSHKNELHKLEFAQDACISDVRERASELLQMDAATFKVLSRGRELASATSLASLRSILARPVKLMIVEKLQPPQPAAAGEAAKAQPKAPKGQPKATKTQTTKAPAPYSKEAMAARLAKKQASPTRIVDRACTDLPTCESKVRKSLHAAQTLCVTHCLPTSLYKLVWSARGTSSRVVQLEV